MDMECYSINSTMELISRASDMVCNNQEVFDDKKNILQTNILQNSNETNQSLIAEMPEVKCKVEKVETNDGVTRCKHCAKEFRSKKVCSEHERAQGCLAVAHRMVAGKPRPRCPECDMDFSRNDHLKRHLLIHWGVRPFSCEYCSRAFSRRDKLNNHKRSHEGCFKLKSVSSGKPATQSAVPVTTA